MTLEQWQLFSLSTFLLVTKNEKDTRRSERFPIKRLERALKCFMRCIVSLFQNLIGEWSVLYLTYLIKKRSFATLSKSQSFVPTPTLYLTLIPINNVSTYTYIVSISFFSWLKFSTFWLSSSIRRSILQGFLWSPCRPKDPHRPSWHNVAFSRVRWCAKRRKKIVHRSTRLHQCYLSPVIFPSRRVRSIDQYSEIVELLPFEPRKVCVFFQWKVTKAL